MANEINLNGLTVVSGGTSYKFTATEKIYAELGISQSRFAELLARDFYTPTLSASPTSSTVSYTDTDGTVNTFQVGQFARVADSTQEGGYKIWQCVNNSGTTASWVSSYDVMKAYVTNAISTLATKAELSEGLANKVDKVSGKGLSTNDFTAALKTKLEGLSNYDDTSLNNSITSLQNQFNALVNADADAAIDTFNEIVAFLAGVENTETLEGILADISTQISGKMDKVTLAAVATSGSYNDLSNKPTIPTVNNATLTIQKNGTSVGTFTANASSNKSINITVPTKTSELTNDSGFKTTDNNTTYSFEGGTNGFTVTPSGGSAQTVSVTPSIGAASTSAAGLMSAADKTKLNGIATGANAYSLPTATSSVLGGVKVGSNISVSSGTISLTKANVTSALGYTPPTTDTNTTYSAGTGLKLSGTTFSADGSAIINSLDEGTSPALRTDYIVAQYAGGGTTTTSYHRRTLANVFAALTQSDITSALGYTPPTADTNTTYSAGSGISLSGTSFSHADTSTLSGAYGPTANVTGSNGATIVVPQITVDGYGHVTAVTNRTYTSVNTDTDTHYTTAIRAGASGTNSNAATSNPYVKVLDNTTYRSQIRLVGGGATSVSSDASGNITISSTDNNTTYSAATTSANGLMTAAMVTKLNGIAAGANAYSLPTATSSVLGGVKVGSNITVSSGTISLSKANVTSALGYTPPTTNTTYSVATTSANGLMSSTDKTKMDRLESYTTASTVASLNVGYQTIYVTLTANASLSASATGTSYNGRTITAYVYTAAARTITIPTTGSYVSMCGSSFTTKAGGWVEFNLTCIAGVWHIAKLEQE